MKRLSLMLVLVLILTGCSEIALSNADLGTMQAKKSATDLEAELLADTKVLPLAVPADNASLYSGGQNNVNVQTDNLHLHNFNLNMSQFDPTINLDGYDNYKQNINKYIDFIEAKGFNGILFPLALYEGYYLHTSAQLDNLSWQAYDGDYLQVLLDALALSNSDLQVYINMETLAHRNIEKPDLMEVLIKNPQPEMIPVDVFGFVAQELIDNYAITGLYCEAMTKEEAEAVYSVTQETSVPFIYCGDPERVNGAGDYFNAYPYAFYTDNPADNIEGTRDIGLGGTDYTLLTAKNYGKQGMITLASEWGLPIGAEYNVLRYFALKYGNDMLSGYNFFVWSNEQFDYHYGDELWQSKTIDVVSDAKNHMVSRPIANLIIDYPMAPIFSHDYNYMKSLSMDMIMNTLSASGYDVVISEEPLAYADMYYVWTHATSMTADGWKDEPDAYDGNTEMTKAYYWLYATTGEEPSDEAVVEWASKDKFNDLSEALLGLKDSGKPVIYHQMNDIPEGQNWMKLLDYYGLSHDYEIIASMPDTVAYDGETYSYSGLSSVYEGEPSQLLMHGFEATNSGYADNVDVIVYGDVEGQSIPMILEKDNVYLLNGNSLHMNVSTLLAKDLAGYCQSSSNAYMTMHEDMATVFATVDERVTLKITDEPLSVNVRIYDVEGNLREDSVVASDGTVDRMLYAYELMVVEPYGNTYYVSATGAEDNEGLSEETPTKYLQYILDNLQSGDTLILQEGVYRDSYYIANKYFDHQVRIIAEPGVIFDGGMEQLEGFLVEECANLLIKGLEVKNYKCVGINVHYSDNVIVKDCLTYNNGFDSSEYTWDHEGYGINAKYSSNITIVSNEVYDCGPIDAIIDTYGKLGTGINTFELTNSVIQRNKSYNNKGGGILVEDGNNVVVSDNIAYGHTVESYLDPSDPDYGKWWCGNLWLDGGHDVDVFRNTFDTSIAGIRVSDLDDQAPYGYRIYNNSFNGNTYGIEIFEFKKPYTASEIAIYANSFSDNVIDTHVE